MSASIGEVQDLADKILELLGVRMRAGQLVIHFNEGVVQRCETNTVHRARTLDRRTPEVPADPPTGERRLLADRRTHEKGT